MKSVIYKFTDAQFTKIVNASNSQMEILGKVGLKQVGSNFITIQKRIKQLGLYDALLIRNKLYLQEKLKDLKRTNTKYSLENIFCINSPIKQSDRIKRLMVNELGIKPQCAICGIVKWNDKHLVLSLHHINGISSDNRIENLQLLCPNCHSQTDNFAGKKTKKKYYCKQCGKMIVKNTKNNLCVTCTNFNKRKVKRPPKDVLQGEVKRMGYCATGRKYGVSDGAIRKWLK